MSESNEKPTVLIIGSNRGIGLSLASQYARSGWRVCGTYRAQSKNEAEELLALTSDTLELDLTDEESISEAAKVFGSTPLDLLINCAASGNGANTMEDTTASQLLSSFQVTVVGTFLTTKAFLPNLKKAKAAKIVNVSSNAGSISDNGSGGNWSYRISKAALNQLTMNTARELASEGIACVALHPGWIKTKMSGFTGHMGPDEAAEKIRSVIDTIDMSKTAKFLHRDGHELSW